MEKILSNILKTTNAMTKKSRQKFKYLENKKTFLDEIKSIFLQFQRLSVAKNCLRPETAPITILAIKRLLWYILWDIVAWVWNFQLLLICKSSKLSSYNYILKNMSKIPISDLNKRGLFFKFAIGLKS